jgi:hypothetical protein
MDEHDPYREAFPSWAVTTKETEGIVEIRAEVIQGGRGEVHSQ